jgi:hypothetical protein
MPSPSCNRFDVLAARNRCPPATRAPTQFDGPNLRDAVGAHRGLILIETNNVGSRAVAGARLICRPRTTQDAGRNPPTMQVNSSSTSGLRDCDARNLRTSG